MPKIKKEDNKEKKPITTIRGGIPMTEEEYSEWQKSFQDIEDCIKKLK